MDTEEDFPLIPPALLQVLNQMYPEESYQEGWEYEKVLFKGGQRDVVRFLNQKASDQLNRIGDGYHV